jgi:eukaryotic-like serine/threonine-protein kinase
MQQQDTALDDDRLMSLVDSALAQPPGEREAYLRRECAGDAQLLEQAREYVESEERMGGFLLEPFCTLDLFDPALEPGELLEDRFRIVREVGAGGMAIVYEAIDETLGKRIAVKCAKAGFQTRLTPEVRHATEVAHDNVCKIFDFNSAGTDRGEIDFITMEFLDGRTLTERLRQGPLPEREARAIARQLCAGLAAAHRNQVIHGDLKSNNVILTQAADGSPRAVITDFGLAHCSGEGCQPAGSAPGGSGGAVGGAPDYMAPELWRGEKPSVASDIYALGCICYEMLSGTRLREPGAPGQELPARKPPRVHPKWDGILARCLDPDPARRYGSVEELKKALDPHVIPGWMWVAAGVVLAAAVGVGVWDIATAPKETVRLAVAPLEGAADATLVQDMSGQVNRIKGNAQTRFKLLPPGKTAGATHLLHGTLRPENGKLTLHAQLTDMKSSVDAKKWDAEYAPNQTRYIPVALAGVVTETFHLLPPMANATVNAGALQDYQKGMDAVRWDSRVDEAIAAFRRAVEADSDSPLTYAGLAEAQWVKFYATRDQAWLAQTTESERQAELRNSDLAAIHRISGLLLYGSREYDQAITEYQRAIELEPNNSDAYRRLGKAFEANRQIDRALAAYREAVRVGSGYYRNQQDLGAFWYARANYEEAVKYLVKAVELAPGEPKAHSDLGQVYQASGRFTQAEEEFRRALGLKETQSAQGRLGFAMLYQGRERDAIPFFRRALGLGTESYIWWTYLGIAYRRANLPAESERASRHGQKVAEEQVLLDPGASAAHYFLAYLCARLGEGSRAESEIKQALQLSPDDADARWMAALTYEALGLREKTIEVLQKAPHGVLADVSRWPDVADLAKNPRFLQLLGSH